MITPDRTITFEVDLLEMDALQERIDILREKIKKGRRVEEFSWSACMTEDFRYKTWMHEFEVGSGPWWLKRKPMQLYGATHA